jgi:succinate-semialdehyde dehydrogenase/glutarate-semialdehyde dehydrogenase
MISKYRNAGQTCVCANRLFVQDGVYDAFVEKFKLAVEKLRVGDGLEPGVTQGPLINSDAIAKVEALLADAVAKGGKIVTGGGRKLFEGDLVGGEFFQPTILAEATTKMRLAQEEIFGPVAPIFRFRTEDEAVALANDTIYGLAAYFYSRDNARVWRVAEALEYGMVGINEGLISTELAPFGGVKQSGLGREGSKYGVEDFVEVKYMCFGGIA